MGGGIPARFLGWIGVKLVFPDRKRRPTRYGPAGGTRYQTTSRRKSIIIFWATLSAST